MDWAECFDFEPSLLVLSGTAGGSAFRPGVGRCRTEGTRAVAPAPRRTTWRPSPGPVAGGTWPGSFRKDWPAKLANKRQMPRETNEYGTQWFNISLNL